MKDPSYYHLGDHTECVQIDFDPDVISFSELLDLFWQDHNPWIRSWSTQYQAALYLSSEDQLAAALEQKSTISRPSKEVQTLVKPLQNFYIAEDYHQKYYLQQIPAIMREFEEYFRYFSDFNDSPTAAKVNGFASGKGSRDALTTFLPFLGLSEKTTEILMKRSAR